MCVMLACTIAVTNAVHCNARLALFVNVLNWVNQTDCLGTRLWGLAKMTKCHDCMVMTLS